MKIKREDCVSCDEHLGLIFFFLFYLKQNKTHLFHFTYQSEFSLLLLLPFPPLTTLSTPQRE